jgi:predicted TIM-barrel fold metal-dependent hydrolase
LQQEWDYANSGDYAPTYYLSSDAPLYYYSFTDAFIAKTYQSLSKSEQARFDPMITGFNPADMYAVDHIKRVLKLFPGVFTGIGEFSIHKEFVSAKTAGGPASLTNPSLDRIFDFAAESGLLVLFHNDVDIPFAKEGTEPVYFKKMKELLKRHPKTKFIWAHVGLGRVVHPARPPSSADPEVRSAAYSTLIAEMLADTDLKHVYFDISWDEVAKYLLASPEKTQASADLMNRYPERFLFGTDSVAPKTRDEYLKIYKDYGPLWKLLSPSTSEKVRKGNYERLFDEARDKVRKWETAHP